MAERSKRIILKVDEKEINKETIKLYKKYKIGMSIKELSEKTIYNYEKDLYSWFSYIHIFQDNKPITEIDEDDLTEYFYYCKGEGNNSRRIKRRMSSISAFYIFLKKKRMIKENPMEYIDRPQKDTDVVVQTFLNQEQVDELIDKLEEKGNLQLLTYVCLGLSSLGRVNALTSVTWEQLSLEEMCFKDVTEKEGYVVELSFDDYTKELLEKLKEQRENKGIDCPYVFISLYDGKYERVENSTANNWVKGAGRLIGIDTLHNHDLRHSGANIMKDAGADLQTVSRCLNHSGTDVTIKHYLKENTSKLKEDKIKFGCMKNRKK